MNKHTALEFVLMIGVVSFFADFTYEGSRSITGPYLAVLGATATVCMRRSISLEPYLGRCWCRSCDLETASIVLPSPHYWRPRS